MEKCYFSTSEDVEDFQYVFPQASDTQSSSIILHPPSKVWGYDGNQLITGVMASCHLATNTWYTWYRDGNKVKEGNNCCCLIIKSPGSYLVEVQGGEALVLARCFYCTVPSCPKYSEHHENYYTFYTNLFS